MRQQFHQLNLPPLELPPTQLDSVIITGLMAFVLVIVVMNVQSVVLGWVLFTLVIVNVVLHKIHNVLLMATNVALVVVLR